MDRGRHEPMPSLALTSPLRWDPRLSSRGYRSSGGLSGFLTPRRLVIGGAILVILLLLFVVGSGGDDAEPVDDLASRVEAAESQAGYTDIEVAVDGTTVTLSGTVASAADKLAATRVAESVPDVITVIADAVVAGDAAPIEDPTAATPTDLELQSQLTAASIRNPIQFETGSADLLDSSLTTLDEIVTLLQSLPEVRVEIGGHTDADGEAEANQALSEARAAAVLTYLTTAGVDAGRLTSVGYGDTEPVASNETQEGKAQNRRIEFNIVAG